MLAEGLIRPGHYMVPGYIKYEIAQRLGLTRAPLFNNDRPIVLYNAHRAPEFSSWPRFIEPILGYFGDHQEFNLIVAPHVKMFHRLPDRIRERWRNRSSTSYWRIPDPEAASLRGFASMIKLTDRAAGIIV